MFHKIRILSIFLLLVYLMTTEVYSQTSTDNTEPAARKNEKYSGGMLVLQGGLISYHNTHQQLQKFSYGFGGILRLYVHPYICVGIYGGTQKMNYSTQDAKSSYLQIGYGGPLIGMSTKKNKFRYSCLVSMGGGSIKNLHINKQSDNTLIDASLYKIPVFTLSPLLSIDYAISPKIAFTLQATCLFGFNKQQNTLYNPCLQMGILFSH